MDLLRVCSVLRRHRRRRRLRALAWLLVPPVLVAALLVWRLTREPSPPPVTNAEVVAWLEAFVAYDERMTRWGAEATRRDPGQWHDWMLACAGPPPGRDPAAPWPPRR